MEENKTEALTSAEEAAQAQPEAPAPAEPQFSQETLQALAKAVAAYMQPEQPAPTPESPPAEKPTKPAPAEKEEPAEQALTPEEQKAAEAAKKEELKRKRRKRRIRELRALLIKTALLLVVIYVLFFKIVGVTVMPSGDMYPRIDNGDLLLYYRLNKDDIKAQDIVVLIQDGDALRQIMSEREGNAPDMSLGIRLPGQGGGLLRGLAEKLGLVLAENEEMYVCRVVAAAGDTVEVTDEGSLKVNGNYMYEPNIFYDTEAYIGFVDYPLTLGKGQYFVMADKRNGGADSRFFGPVDAEQILGNVITIVRRNSL